VIDVDFKKSSVASIHEKINKGELTPKHVVSSTAERVKSFNNKFKVFTYFNENVLEEQLKNFPDCLNNLSNKPLYAIPVGVKDTFNTYDMPTEMGSVQWKGFTPGNDARVIFNIRLAGAIVAGKTETAEFAVHALGDSINPHDVARTPGTSSSGSAISVALGMVPVALGTQTGGSIIRPASYCGIYGCKPSFGLIPRTGVLKTTDTLDQIGYFTYHAEDLARVLDAIRVKGDNFPIINRGISKSKSLRKSRFKIALVKTHTWDLAECYAQEAILSFAKKLQEFKQFDVLDCNLPSGLDDAHAHHRIIYYKLLSYYFSEEYKNKELVSNVLKEAISDGFKIDNSQFFIALEHQKKVIEKMDKFFEEVDAIICLSTAGIAPFRNDKETDDPALIWSYVHLPVVNVPLFRENSLPFGMQVVMRKYGDYELFNLINILVKEGLIPASSNIIKQ